MSAKKLSLWSLSWPLFVEQGLRLSIGTVDTLMVSHVSDNAVAALGVAWQIVIFTLVVFNFIGIGSSVVITHHLGAGDRAGADRISRAALGVNTWLGVGMSLLIASQSRRLLELMQLPPALFEYAVPFLTLLGASLFLDAQSMALCATLRAHGRTRPVMLVTGGAKCAERDRQRAALVRPVGAAQDGRARRGSVERAEPHARAVGIALGRAPRNGRAHHPG